MTKREERRKTGPGAGNDYKLLELTPTEVFFLESTLCAIPTPQEKAEGLLSLRPFLLRLGSLFLEGKGGTVAISEEEAWHLRDKVPLAAKMGSEPVGMSLHRKLYSILLEFDDERRIEVESSGVNEPGRADIVKLIKEAHDAGASSDTHPEPHDDPRGGPGPGAEAEP